MCEWLVKHSERRRQSIKVGKQSHDRLRARIRAVREPRGWTPPATSCPSRSSRTAFSLTRSHLLTGWLYSLIRLDSSEASNVVSR